MWLIQFRSHLKICDSLLSQVYFGAIIFLNEKKIEGSVYVHFSSRKAKLVAHKHKQKLISWIGIEAILFSKYEDETENERKKEIKLLKNYTSFAVCTE